MTSKGGAPPANVPKSSEAIVRGRGQSTLVLSANSCGNIVNFRKGLIRALRERGYRVAVLAPDDADRSRVEALGIEFHAVRIQSSGTSPWQDARLFIEYLRTLRRLRPSAYLGFTAKPNIYGSLAARLVGAKVINNISGLGTAFIRTTGLTQIVTALYRVALRGSAVVFFQNADDRDLFLESRIVRPDQARLLPGSGVDLERFRPLEEGRVPGPFRFLFVGRLLWDKGVAEYVAAARTLRSEAPDVVFQILGQSGVDNRTAVLPEMVAAWQQEGAVDYLGTAEDVRPIIGAADCVVLPSYREGLPRALLEGSAMAKPLISTNVPGCKDVVEDGVNGFLCAPASADALAEAMRKMLAASPEQRRAMGASGRKIVEDRFDERLVIEEYLRVLENR